MFRPPSLEPPKPVEPLRLLRLLKSLGAATDEPPISPELMEEARDLIRAQMASSAPLIPSRTIVRPLLRCLDEVTAPHARRTAAELLLRSESLGWRRLWSLWQLVPEARGEVTPVLARRLTQGLSTSKRFRERVPKWLLDVNILRALENPVPHLLRYCSARRIAVTRLPQAIDLMDAPGMGRDIVASMIKHGASEWWSLAPPDQVRAWASVRGSPTLQAAVLERQLLELSAADLQLAGGGRRDLVTWGLEHLGDPALRRGAWQQVSDEAQRRFERLMLAAEFGRILDQFRREAADHTRATYWARKADMLWDARYVEAKDSAVCMFVLAKTILVIEFGTVGNACYFYLVPEEAPPLRALPISNRWRAADFKDKNGLRLGGHRFQFLKRLNHTHGWTRNFNRYLHEQRFAR